MQEQQPQLFAVIREIRVVHQGRQRFFRQGQQLRRQEGQGAARRHGQGLELARPGLTRGIGAVLILAHEGVGRQMIQLQAQGVRVPDGLTGVFRHLALPARHDFDGLLRLGIGLFIGFFRGKNVFQTPLVLLVHFVSGFQFTGHTLSPVVQNVLWMFSTYFLEVLSQSGE